MSSEAVVRERLTRPQAKILQSDTPFLWVIAGYAGGKTRGLAQFITEEMLVYPGCFGCLYLNTGSQLDSAAWEEIKKYWVDKGISWSGPNINSVVTLGNGSRLKLQTLAVRNEQLLAGPEWSFIAVDEAHLMKREYWDVLKSRARRKYGSRKVRVYGLSVGPGEYLVDEFIHNDDPDYDTIAFTTYDNAANLPPGQIEKYEKMYPEGPMRDRYMLGKIVPVEGVAYRHLVSNMDRFLVSPDDIPTDRIQAWLYGQDLNMGGPDPWVMLEGGIGPGNILYITKELYRPAATYNELKTELRDLYRDGWPIASDHGAHVHALMVQDGFNMVKAQKDVDLGIQTVRHRIELDGIRISKDCVNLIREISNYKIKALPSGKEVPEHKYSHSPDALRYMVMMLDKPSIFSSEL